MSIAGITEQTELLDGASARPLDEMAALQHDLDVDSADVAEMRRKRNARHEQTQRTALAGEHAAARYRSLAMRSRFITDVEFRVLCIIIDYADGDLTNSFVSPETIRKQLGGRKRKIRAVYAAIARLTAKKFLQRHKGKGWQLCLPADVLAPGAGAWHGPADWSNRWKEVGR